MLAEILAIAIVTLAIAVPGVFLLRYAWRRGGTPKRLAIFTLAIAALLILWLLFYPNQGPSQSHISSFIGAWGILFMAVGIVTVIGAAVKSYRERKQRRQPE